MADALQYFNQGLSVFIVYVEMQTGNFSYDEMAIACDQYVIYFVTFWFIDPSYLNK